MKLDYSLNGKVKVDMTDYTDKLLEEFREHYKLDGLAETPAGQDLLANKEGEVLNDEMWEVFHTFVAKCLFMCKRSRPDIQPKVAVLAMRVQEPTSDDWKKLLRLMKYINGTKNYLLTLSSKDLHVVKWYIDASFAVHPDFRSHTGAVMTMGQGTVHRA